MSVNNNLQTGSGRIRVAKFTASGSWVAPAGVYSIRALAVGGGGGGGATKAGSSSVNFTGGGGGGGGVVDDIFPVVPGTTYTVTIGTGGAGANTTTAAGSNGTDTTFGSLFTAPGGQGGVTNSSGTGVVPTSNPGGSMGGWGRSAGSTDTVSAGHGCGAAAPILLVGRSSALGVGDAYEASLYTFFNGISNVTVPVVNSYEYSAESILSILANVESNTTYYPGVKRTAIVARPKDTSMFSPGYSWRGLGAGGMSLPSDTLANGIPLIHSNIIFETSAGKVFPPFGTSNASHSTSGTNAVANTGAGGGGSTAGGTNTTVANGGNGGSGYVEVVWQE